MTIQNELVPDSFNVLGADVEAKANPGIFNTLKVGYARVYRISSIAVDSIIEGLSFSQHNDLPDPALNILLRE